MILGIGVDIVEIKRVEAAIARKRFCRIVFTEAEMAYAANRRGECCAGMFAAKEAAAKALGTGFLGFSPKDIEIGHDEFKKPFIRPNGAFREQLVQKRVQAIHVSISHCRSHATATVIMEGGLVFESSIQYANEEN